MCNITAIKIPLKNRILMELLIIPPIIRRQGQAPTPEVQVGSKRIKHHFDIGAVDNL
jgi:hypothetical protein